MAHPCLPTLRRNLLETIVPFWYPHSLDEENGGYHIGLEADGSLRRDAAKMIVTQARMVWFFSRLARAGYGDRYLEAAETGFRFLHDRMWDPDHGGFFWEVDTTGRRRAKPKKHLYGQAFALYGLSEYALASGRRAPLALADRLFQLLEERSHDEVHGGYIEAFERDWSPSPIDEVAYLHHLAAAKLMNTHLHLMEAMTSYCRVSPDRLAMDRLRELVAIQTSAVVRKVAAACTDVHERDWTPRLESRFARVSYGHDLESIWLLIDADTTAGLSPSIHRDLFIALFDTSLRCGYDEDYGGFYDSGPLGGPADRRGKVWWVQAEALVSAVAMYFLTEEDRYRFVFERTLEFIERTQVDRSGGEWHAVIHPDGRITGCKAEPWKAAYHNGRAMIECIERWGGQTETK